jgi:pimeloyl-ACP methyl ester carboxylesterase
MAGNDGVGTTDITTGDDRAWKVARQRLEVDVSDVAPAGGDTVVAHLLTGPRPGGSGSSDTTGGDGAAAPVLWCCFPGGGMTKAYWDLRVPAELGLGEYSMARWLAGRGDRVLIVDHLGIGESSRPDDGWTLTPATLADVNAAVVERVMATLDPPRRVIGVGHSAGANLLVRLQARHQPFAALVLLGFGGGGSMDAHLDEEVLAYAGDPGGLTNNLVELTRQRYTDPLPTMPRGSSDLLVGHPMEPAVHEAIVAARTELLALAGLASMVEGNVGPELAAISVPVLIAVGDHDIAGPPHASASHLPSAPEVTSLVVPDAGHNHNVAPTRQYLWNRMATWAHSLP